MFLTHSFGEAIPRFASSRVISAREWRLFGPDDPLNEAEFNLASAEVLLDIPYAPDDVRTAEVGAT